MTVRQAVVDDAEQIAAIWNPMIRDTAVTFNPTPKTADDVSAMISTRVGAGRAFIVALEVRQIIGFATYDQFRRGDGYANTMEHTIILAPFAQGRGAGRAMMGAIEDHARKNGAHSMIAGVSSENVAGISFHQRLGYRQIAVLPEVGHRFGRWMDLHLMQKLL